MEALRTVVGDVTELPTLEAGVISKIIGEYARPNRVVLFLKLETKLSAEGLEFMVSRGFDEALVCTPNYLNKMRHCPLLVETLETLGSKALVAELDHWHGRSDYPTGFELVDLQSDPYLIFMEYSELERCPPIIQDYKEILVQPSAGQSVYTRNRGYGVRVKFCRDQFVQATDGPEMITEEKGVIQRLVHSRDPNEGFIAQMGRENERWINDYLGSLPRAGAGARVDLQ